MTAGYNDGGKQLNLLATPAEGAENCNINSLDRLTRRNGSVETQPLSPRLANPSEHGPPKRKAPARTASLDRGDSGNTGKGISGPEPTRTASPPASTCFAGRDPDREIEVYNGRAVLGRSDAQSVTFDARRAGGLL